MHSSQLYLLMSSFAWTTVYSQTRTCAMWHSPKLNFSFQADMNISDPDAMQLQRKRIQKCKREKKREDSLENSFFVILFPRIFFDLYTNILRKKKLFFSRHKKTYYTYSLALKIIQNTSFANYNHFLLFICVFFVFLFCKFRFIDYTFLHPGFVFHAAFA